MRSRNPTRYGETDFWGSGWKSKSVIVPNSAPSRLIVWTELDSIWRSRAEREQERWDSMLQALNDYKREHGDTNVPSTGKDAKLGSWVRTQRTGYHKKQLAPHRQE